MQKKSWCELSVLQLLQVLGAQKMQLFEGKTQ